MRHGRTILSTLVCGSVVCAGVAVGCHWGQRKHAQPPNPATRPTPPLAPTSMPAPPPSSPSPVTFEDTRGGIRLTYPAQWKPQPSSDYVLVLAPPDGAGSSQKIRLDIPDLPPHFPGMIKLGLIQNGYIDDLRKQHPDLKLEESTEQTLRGASARLLRSTWQQNGHPFHDIALMMIHAERVFILSMQSDDDHLGPTRALFDEIARSVTWTK